MPQYVVKMNWFFNFLKPAAFNNVTQAHRRVIAASAVVAFKGDLEERLRTAAADLRLMQTMIFYKSANT